MKRNRLSWTVPLSFLTVSAFVACTSNSDVVLHPGPGAPTTVPTTGPTLAPTGSPTPGVTPTASPTSIPTGIAVSCTSPTDPLPGNYTTVLSFGNVAGTTYTQNTTSGSGIWEVDAWAAATPSPSPTPTVTPTVSPTATPTPVTYNVYEGAYTVGGFSGITTGGTPYSASATTGCAILIATQGGQPINTGYNAFADGFPVFDPSVTNVNATFVASGNITAFTVTGLGANTGTGAFTLDNGTTGSVAIQTSQVVTFDRVRRLVGQIGRQKALLRRHPIRF